MEDLHVEHQLVKVYDRSVSLSIKKKQQQELKSQLVLVDMTRGNQLEHWIAFI